MTEFFYTKSPRDWTIEEWSAVKVFGDQFYRAIGNPHELFELRTMNVYQFRARFLEQAVTEWQKYQIVVIDPVVEVVVIPPFRDQELENT